MSSLNLISGFSFSYPNASPTVQNLNLNLEAGSKIALVASNGVGKTTILNELWRNSFTSNSAVKFDHKKVYFTQHIPNLEFNPQKITENYFDLLLQIYIAQTEQTQGRYLDFYPENYAEWIMDLVTDPIPDFRADLIVYLAAFRINPSVLPSSFALLSPGTKKKLLLAILLASKPNLILADELTNHLDKEVVISLENILERSQIPILMVDHNQSFLSAVANQFVFIPDNKDRYGIHFKGRYIEFRDYLNNLQTQQQNQYNQIVQQKKELKSKGEELQVLARKYSESAKIGSMKRAVARNIEKLDSEPILNNADLSKKVKFKTHENKAKIKANLLCRSNLLEPVKLLIGQDKTQVILNFELYLGEKVRIGGKNGTGKSTLVKSLCYNFEHGSNDGFGQYVSGKWDLGQAISRKDIFMLSQLTDYPEGLTLENYLQNNTDLDQYQLLNFLKNLELSKFKLSTFISNLSLGEFIRLQLGCMGRLIGEIKLIILDEPGNFLDIFTQQAMIDMLKKYNNSLILITHDDILAQAIGFDREFTLK